MRRIGARRGRCRPEPGRAALLLVAVFIMVPLGASAEVAVEFSLAVRPFLLGPSRTHPRPSAVWEATDKPLFSARAWARPATGVAAGAADPSAEGGRKRPWLAGAEVFGVNMGLWAYSRFIAKEDWAYISWESVKTNFRNGFEYDDDGFFTNFFMHPYNGLFFYNAARSLGMNYAGSALYTLGGSLMWEMFLENQYPSTNDLVTTVAGGVYFGELAYRMSSLILDDTATGANRAWREILALLVNPMRGLNRLILGETRRTSDVNRQIRAPVDGYAALTSTFVLTRKDPQIGAAGTAVELDFIYGERFTAGAGRKPFDLIIFNGGLRMAGRWAHTDIDSHALIWGHESHNGNGGGRLIGFFQHFDYLSNELIDFGGTSLAGGVVSFFPLGAGGKLEFRSSAQLGVLLISATENIRFPETSGEYLYGMGPMIKFDARLDHGRWGWLSLRFNHYRNYAIEGKNSADRPSHDFLSVLKTHYGVAIRRGVGLKLEYSWYFRQNYSEGYDRVDTTLSHLGLSLTLGFS